MDVKIKFDEVKIKDMEAERFSVRVLMLKGEPGMPTDAQVEQAVIDWLDDHPEATTTVQDGSITNAKLASSFVTPGTAAAYSSSATYAVGDYVFYGGTLYRCITAITTAETWTAAHWTAAVLGDDVSDLRTAITLNEAEYIDFSMQVLNDYTLQNDFIYGRYLTNGFSNVTTYARNKYAYPAGKYEIGPYAANGFVAVEYISDTEGSAIFSNWSVSKEVFTATKPFYVSFNNISGSSDIESINANFVVKRLTTETETLEDRVNESVAISEEALGNFEKTYSKNRYDGVYYSGGGYVNTGSGEISTNSGHAYSSWVDISNHGTANVVISNTHNSQLYYANLRYAFYKSDKTFISGGIAPTLQNDSPLNRDYAVITTPADATFMRFSLPNAGFTLATDWQIEYAEVTAYSVYTRDYVGIKTSAIEDNAIIEKHSSMTYGVKPEQASAATLSDGESIVVENNSVMKNQCISFFANFSGTFNGVLVGHGKESYGYYIKVDGTNMTYCSNGAEGTAIAHGLTISQFVGVCVEVDVDLNVKVTITTAGGTYTKTSQINSSWRGNVFAESINTSFTDAVLTWNSNDYKCPIWAFGDSYFTLYSPTRWTYYVAKAWRFDNILLNAYPGENSESGYRDFTNALKHGTPKYVLWCEGMNDPDTSSAPNATWLAKAQAVKDLCDAYGITLIYATIPIVTNTSYGNTYKNEWIRNSGVRYVDFATALANVEGWLSDDGVHPSEIGGRFMALKLLADVPEIYQGK